MNESTKVEILALLTKVANGEMSADDALAEIGWEVDDMLDDHGTSRYDDGYDAGYEEAERMAGEEASAYARSIGARHLARLENLGLRIERLHALTDDTITVELRRSDLEHPQFS